jgi:Cof subfamily protein (haloacid dehalogenase superfamily)
MTPVCRRPRRVRAVISDVDGTLLTDDKSLTAATQGAVAMLRERGIAFCITSSRPPRGLRMLVEPLGLTTPMAGFNGAILARPDLSIIAEEFVLPPIARRVVDLLDEKRAQVWVFSGQDWLVRDPRAPYVEHEEHTVQFRPTVVADFEGVLDTAAKIVGVSEDPALLAQCESHLRAVLGAEATVVRSQPYYLDITSAGANKGTAFSKLAELLGISPAEIAVVGDGSNDVAMFARSGLSIAMGNGSPEVQGAADFVTESNRKDGFAVAVHRFILSDDGSEMRVESVGLGDRS